MKLINLSEIFKAAHQIAKTIRAHCSDYRTAFRLALIETYASFAQEEAKEEKTVKEKLLNLGLSVWGESYGKDRIYINVEMFKQVFGLELSFYQTGNISSALLNGEKISNSKAKRLINEKVYFDLLLNKFVGTEMTPII